MQLPVLDYLAGPRVSADLVVLAHGGQEESMEVPHRRRPALLRMWPFAATAHRAAPHAGVGLLRYRYRGWNHEHAHAAADLVTVLDALPATVRRVILIGHSMGGRAVLRAGVHPLVTGVLAMAPWLPFGEPTADLPGRLVVLAHGADDTVTDPRLTALFATRLRSAGLPVASLRVSGETHSLLARYDDWGELVGRFVRSSVGSGPPDPYLKSVTSSDPARQTDDLPSWTPRRRTGSAVVSVAAARIGLSLTSRR